ncbi:hypothetical protein ACFWUZ_06675 [Streptomyces sp. NPDC058646]|uniref:hypothetical protein n=1 Tax=Streptomyces sp. NPDC058646 TaxID=3346574 RepID=UPI0036642879
MAEVLERRLPKAGPGPLLCAPGRLRIRHLPGTRSVFSPRGEVTRAAAKALTTVPQGSFRALPDGEVLRMFPRPSPAGRTARPGRPAPVGAGRGTRGHRGLGQIGLPRAGGRRGRPGPGASGAVYRPPPGPVDGCRTEQLAAGDLVAVLG